jgi:hypothetical protein
MEISNIETRPLLLYYSRVKVAANVRRNGYHGCYQPQFRRIEADAVRLTCLKGKLIWVLKCEACCRYAEIINIQFYRDLKIFPAIFDKR